MSHTSRGRGREEEKAFFTAWQEAYRQLHPTPEKVHLTTLAFAAAAIRYAIRFACGQSWFASELDQYAALHVAQRAQLGRCLKPVECDRLRAASRKMWEARLVLHRAALVA